METLEVSSPRVLLGPMPSLGDKNRNFPVSSAFINGPMG